MKMERQHINTVPLSSLCVEENRPAVILSAGKPHFLVKGCFWDFRAAYKYKCAFVGSVQCWWNNRTFSCNKANSARQDCEHADYSVHICNKQITAAGSAWFSLILSWKSACTSSYSQQVAPKSSQESRNLLLSWFQVSWRQQMLIGRRGKRLWMFLSVISVLDSNIFEYLCLNFLLLCLQQSFWNVYKYHIV